MKSTQILCVSVFSSLVLLAGDGPAQSHVILSAGPSNKINTPNGYGPVDAGFVLTARDGALISSGGYGVLYSSTAGTSPAYVHGWEDPLALDTDGELIVRSYPGDLEHGWDAFSYIDRIVGGVVIAEQTIPGPPGPGQSGGWPAGFGIGKAVACDGDTVLISGAPNGTYVFLRQGGQWIQQFPTLPYSPDFIDLDGDIVVGGGGAGVARIFERVSSAAPFIAHSGLAYDGTVEPGPGPSTVLSTPGTGISGVAVRGDRIVVGLVRHYPSLGQVQEINVFDKVAGNWTYTDTLRPSGWEFGIVGEGVSVATDGNWIMAGLYGEQNYEGAAYLYRLNPGGWSEEAKFTAADGHYLNMLGSSVAIDGSRLYVGATSGAYFYDLTLPLPFETSTFCFGDGGDQLGCKDCPCANNVAVGRAAGCGNSTGQGARLVATGRPSLAANSLAFEMAGLPGSGLAMLAVGHLPAPHLASAPCPSGSGVTSVPLDGLLCITQDIQRLGSRATDAGGTIGRSTPGWGGPSPTGPGLLSVGAFAAGQTAYFQGFYRDVAHGLCTTRINTTNATRVVVQP